VGNKKGGTSCFFFRRHAVGGRRLWVSDHRYPGRQGELGRRLRRTTRDDREGCGVAPAQVPASLSYHGDAGSLSCGVLLLSRQRDIPSFVRWSRLPSNLIVLEASWPSCGVGSCSLTQNVTDEVFSGAEHLRGAYCIYRSTSDFHLLKPFMQLRRKRPKCLYKPRSSSFSLVAYSATFDQNCHEQALIRHESNQFYDIEEFS
jgi:hypothetical protein